MTEDTTPAEVAPSAPDAVKVSDTSSADAAVKKEVAAPPKSKPPPGVVFVGALAIAFVFATMQQSDVLNGGDFLKWSNSLFEEHPAPYPAPPLNQLLANVVSVMQMLLMALVFVNDKLLPEGIRENKMAAVFGIFLGANMISSALTKTQAFEIYVGKRLIFSQMAEGRAPNGQDILRAFAKVGIKLDL